MVSGPAQRQAIDHIRPSEDTGAHIFSAPQSAFVQHSRGPSPLDRGTQYDTGEVGPIRAARTVPSTQTASAAQSVLRPQAFAQLPSAQKLDRQAVGSIGVQTAPVSSRPNVLLSLAQLQRLGSRMLPNDNVQTESAHAASELHPLAQRPPTQVPELHSLSLAQPLPNATVPRAAMLAGKHTRTPVCPATHTEPEPQSASTQHALAQRLPDSSTSSSYCPFFKQKPPAHCESSVQPLPTVRGSMQMRVVTSQRKPPEQSPSFEQLSREPEQLAPSSTLLSQSLSFPSHASFGAAIGA